MSEFTWETIEREMRTRHEQEKRNFRLGERDYSQIDKEEFYELYTFLLKMVTYHLDNVELTNHQRISKIKDIVKFMDCAVAFQNEEMSCDPELLRKHPYNK